MRGLVQGVGFRPFVYRQARELGLSGFVRNDSGGVVIEIEGPPDQLSRFRRCLKAHAPRLARIDATAQVDLPASGDLGFVISASHGDAPSATLISPDIAVCDDCLREMQDPADRRFGYPFINCTNCGPRYTIVWRTPYDRSHTSMRDFVMCPECAREYHDPLDRRFHAQPVACPACGPRLILHDGRVELTGVDAIAAAQAALREGQIVALRGLGGFHLAVDAHNDAAVRRLRERKLRAEKPLALMAPDVEVVRRYAMVSSFEAQLLTDVTRPIMILQRRERGARVAPSVAFDHACLGFMLPYTPLHHLLLRDVFDALVLTSGNLCEEPIAIANDEALRRLSGVADLFLLHDREILARCDDSVVRVSAGRRRLLRRARGFVPRPVYLSHPTARPILATGAELKSTVAVSRQAEVFLSQHIGDLDNPAAFAFFQECTAHLCRLLEVEPELLACDLHPEYLSTKWALNQTRIPVVGIQHHHAHLASVLAESNRSERAIGIILDGTGYGTDGTIWGGEILVGDAADFERFAWLEPVPLPGGAMAIRQPWRMGVAYLHYAFGERCLSQAWPFADHLGTNERETLVTMLERRLHSPLTTSCGRLFDGVAALLGICGRNTFEAQAAIALEMAATIRGAGHHRRCSAAEIPGTGRGPLAFAWLIRDLMERRSQGAAIKELARDFHLIVAELFIGSAVAARSETAINVAALSGGVYQNRFFFEYMHRRLLEEGFDVVTHGLVPTNDGGIALGQVVIADARSRAHA